MRTLIAVLILLSFLQTTIIPLDLVLIILILRAHIRSDVTNLYLAVFLGLLISFLEHINLGFTPALYLLLIMCVHFFSQTPINKNIFSVIPVVLIALLIKDVSLSLFLHQTPQIWPKILIEVILSFPLYLAIRIWEERFIVRKDIKLRV